jgi:CubicO group peptidase (beta-lactamase class C family)
MKNRNRIVISLFVLGLLLPAIIWSAETNDTDIAKKLDGFDAYMSKLLKDWNTAGIGVGVVVNNKLVFAKGYGYRDYEKKLPFTPATVCPIASKYEVVHCGRSRHVSGGRKIHLGQAGARVRTDHSV